MSEENKALVRRVIAEVYNQHNVALIAELYPNCIYHSPAVGKLSGEAYRQFLSAALAAFPNGRWTIQDQVAEGDKVVTRFSFAGTHQGRFLNIAPTGKWVSISGMCIDRVVGGKIVEEWEEWDTLGMMQQLGIVPADKAEEMVAV